MSLALEELRSKVIALPGDILLCPGCQAPLVRFTGHTFTNADFTPAADRRYSAADPERYALYCYDCGSGATLSLGTLGTGRGIEDGVAPRMLVRSGSWTGWRELGGE